MLVLLAFFRHFMLWSVKSFVYRSIDSHHL